MKNIVKSGMIILITIIISFMGNVCNANSSIYIPNYSQEVKIFSALRIVFIILAVILLIITVFKYINKKRKIENQKVNSDMPQEDYKKEIMKNKKWLRWGIIGTILSILMAYVFNIIRNFAVKPIIYLYPEKEEDISVKLKNSELITCSYPKYKNRWNVHAEPSGKLLDLNTNKDLYALYYESKNKKSYKVEKDGFVVKNENVADFLEEKLELLGLSYKEKEEFIVYWLPRLEKNKYNYIRFATREEIENNMPLEFSKKPDTLIRIMMTFKKLDRPIKVEE